MATLFGSTGTIGLSATGSAEGFFADAAAVVFFDATGLSAFAELGALGAARPPEAGVAAVEGGTGVACRSRLRRASRMRRLTPVSPPRRLPVPADSLAEVVAPAVSRAQMPWRAVLPAPER